MTQRTFCKDRADIFYEKLMQEIPAERPGRRSKTKIVVGLDCKNCPSYPDMTSCSKCKLRIFSDNHPVFVH